jgi:type II secretory pathway component PulF
MTAEGVRRGGRLAAASRAAAVAQLASRGEFVLEMQEGKRGDADAGSGSRGLSFGGNKFSPRQRLALLRQLSVALGAGLPLVAALRVVAEQAEGSALRDVAQELIDAVEQGDALSAAMKQAQGERAFNTMQVSMVQAGETAVVLDEVMASLATFAQRDLAIREKLRSAAIYPVIVLLLALISIVVILAFILPNIMSSLANTGAALPLPTVLLMQGSDFVRSPWGIGLGVLLLVAGVALWRWKDTPEGRLAFDGLLLRSPVMGTAVRRVALSRFARVLGTLTGAGIGIVEAMRIVRGTLGNEVLAQRIDAAAEEIVRGRSIAEPLGEDGLFPPLLVQVVAMGERTGQLDTLLMQLAETYEQETEVALQRVMSVLPAVLILLLAIVVAFILAAALLPIANMSIAG